jgi:hypothetical protein
MILACLTVMVGACLPSQRWFKIGDGDDELGEDSAVNERTALLQ